mgnify:FL=1
MSAEAWTRAEGSCASRRQMRPGPEALAWAARMRFSALASAETIIDAYAAHLRILAKIEARKAAI